MANVPPGAHNGQGEPVARSGLIEHITPDFAAAAGAVIASGAVYFFQIRSVGGAVADVPPDATAYANRSANFSVTAFGRDRDRGERASGTTVPHFERAVRQLRDGPAARAARRCLSGRDDAAAA